MYSKLSLTWSCCCCCRSQSQSQSRPMHSSPLWQHHQSKCRPPPAILCCHNGGSSPADNHQAGEAPEDPLKLSLSSLDSYFNKLQGSRHSSGTQASLDAYFRKLGTPDAAEKAKSDAKRNAQDEQALSFLKELEAVLSDASQVEARRTSVVQAFSAGGKGPSFFPNIVVGVNAAVFLFGLASPIQTPEMLEVPLPLLCGAKINELIVDGEWWRLITPMFLHDGLIHIGLGTWALLSFGSNVEYVYGFAGFGMLYLLGGLFGNLTSFFHTSAPTVTGTAPLYALVAAWAVYVVQNRNLFGKELQLAVTMDLMQKVFVMAALHFALSDALPADNWAHIGAAFAGLVFGVISAPKLQMNVQLEDVNNNIEMEKLMIAFVTCLGIFCFLYNLGSPAVNEIMTMITGPNDTLVNGDDIGFL